jgi:hypothetical protein
VLANFVNEGKLTNEYLGQLKGYFGVREIWEVAKNNDQAKEMFEKFVASGLITKVD